ncbi:hypothetical protein vseg_019734 [Gypsophila vaccaria]
MPRGEIRQNFLWHNSTEFRRVPLVAWSTVCKPKEEGGMGIKDQGMSNLAMIDRLVNWVTEQRDSLWVRWVNANYIKGHGWIEYMPSNNSSWVWRRICGVKQKLAPGYTDGVWDMQTKGFTPVGCYEWLTGEGQLVPWTRVVWNACKGGP